MNRTEELIIRSKSGDNEAKEILIKENSGLIWSVAKRFIGRGADVDDLYQLGCLGFIKAVDGFNPEFGTQFSTDAVPKISGEIRRFLRDDGAIKVSRGVKERSAVIKSVRNKLLQQTGKEPTICEVSEVTGFTLEEIAVAETATAAVESIHQTSGDEGFNLESVLTNTESEDAILEKISLRQGIKQLPEKEEIVIRLRYYHGLTQQQASKILNISQVQVSRIEKKALAHLKERLM